MSRIRELVSRKLEIVKRRMLRLGGKMSVKHKAQALAITCIDFRFCKMIEEDLKQRHLNGNCDKITWPGASKNHDQVLKAASLSIELHDPNELYIYEHEDCGAYGKDNSQDAHRENASRLADILHEIKPSIKVTVLIATFEGVKPL